MATIHIDATWLTANGPAPYLLTSADSTYILDIDVTVDGTAFIICASNVTLDLNQHTVTYGNSAPITVVNGGFETGDIDDTEAAGWDLTNAPSAAIAANDIYMWGDQLLKLSSITSNEYIISDPITIPTANREYLVTVAPKTTYSSTTIKLTVIDNVTQLPLSVYDFISSSGPGDYVTSAGPHLGYFCNAIFTPTTTNAVCLRIDITPANGNTDNVYLDRASLTHSHDNAIYACTRYGVPSQLAAYQNQMYGCVNPTIRNGIVVQGQANGGFSTALYCEQLSEYNRGKGLTIDDVEVHITGLDTHGISADGGEDISITNCKIYSTCDAVINRMHSPAAMISVGGACGDIIVDDNEIYGSPITGILVGGFSLTYVITSVSIARNVIYQNTCATEGYGITIAALNNFDVSYNEIIADGTTGQRSGRGIFIIASGYGLPEMTDGEIHHNYVDVREYANLEYGFSGLEATALRWKASADYDTPFKRINVHDNTFIPRTDGSISQTHAAIAGRIGFLSPNVDDIDLENVIENNLFKAIIETDNTANARYAAAFDADCDYDFTAPIIRNNIFESNDISLRLGSNDGENSRDGTFISNIIRKNTTEGASRSYRSILAGYWIGQIQNIKLIDSRYENGATSTISWDGSGTKEVSVGWLETVQVLDTNSDPVSGSAVVIKDKAGTTVASGTTDALGLTDTFQIIEKIYKQEGEDPATITEDNRNDHTITIDGGTPTAETFTASGTHAFVGTEEIVVASSYTLTGPVAGAWNEASTFTLTPDGPYTGVITADNSGGGTLTQPAEWVNSSGAKTFTLTPSIPGESQTITVTANPVLGTDPAGITFRTNLGSFPYHGRLLQ